MPCPDKNPYCDGTVLLHGKWCATQMPSHPIVGGETPPHPVAKPTKRDRDEGRAVAERLGLLKADELNASPHGNPEGGPAPSLPHGAARDTNQEDTP